MIRRRDPAISAGKGRVILALAVAVVLVAAFIAGLLGAGDVAGTVLAALERLRAFGWQGALIFVALEWVVAVVGFVPASILGLAAGAIYGTGTGFALAATGMVMGAAAAFGFARSALRPLILRFIDGRAGLGRFDAALARDGWRLVLLLRASPVMPFSLTCYALGLSGIGFRDYMVGTLASLPALLAYVAFGSLGATSLGAARNGGDVRLVLLLVGGAATLLLVLRVARMLMTQLARPSSQA